MKNLEKEYKDLCEQEIAKIDADSLWNKIETALPEKAEASDSNTDIEKDKIIDFNIFKKRLNKGIVPLIGTVAVAMLLVFVVRNYDATKTGGHFQSEMASNTNNGAETTKDTPTAEQTEAAAAEASEDYFTEPSNALFGEAAAGEEECAEAPEERYEVSLEIVAEDEPKVFRCLVTEESDFLELGEEIFVDYIEDCEIGKQYTLQVIYLGESYGKKYFEFYKIIP